MIIRYKTKKLTPLGKNPERQRVAVAPRFEDLVLKERIEDAAAADQGERGPPAYIWFGAEEAEALGPRHAC